MQRRKFKRAFGWLCTLVLMLSGCFPNRKFAFQEPKGASYYRDFATQIEYPNVSSNLSVEAAETTAPLTTDNPADIPAWEMTLDEAVQTALQRSDVLRNLGVSVVTAPNATRTRFDPAITETNPFGGVEAALSDFDATINSSLLWEKRDRPQNFGKNPLFPSLFDQNRATYLSQLAKRTATGATFAVRNNVFYDNNNNPARLFRSDYAGWFEAEWRQPLLQGSGIEYNRIAGPNSGIGQYNGVLIARVNTDISLAEFELGVITFVNDVETAYWNLFFAYRNLQSQVSGRNNVLLTWQLVKEKQRIGARGGEADAEAQARSQYYQLEAFVKESLSGPSGLYAAEQRLRYLLGLPAADGRLIKPVQSPMEGQVIYDWSSALGDALTRRAEIRRQKWAVKRSELQLVAARLNRRPRLDMLSQYRFYGMGNHLIGSRDTTEKLDNMYQTILSGDFQEWQSGVELSYPVGMRAASNAISNAQWTLTREQTLLKEQELKVSHDLSNASREIDRTYQMLQTNYNRQDADRLQVEVLRDRYQAGLSNIFFLLQAQQEYAISTSSYFKSLADYQLALRDFHREKGTLLNYNQIALSESDWAAPAYRDAYLRGQYFTPVLNSDRVGRPGTLSAGAFDPAEERPAIIGDESARVQPPGISPQSATSPGASPATDKPEIVLPNPIRQEP